MIPVYLENDLAPLAAATGQDIKKGELVKLTASGAEAVADDDTARPDGIAAKDQRTGNVLVYYGTTAIEMDGATGHTLAVGDDVYLKTKTTLHGEPEAAAGQKAFGRVVEIKGSKIRFIPRFGFGIEGADAIA